MLYVIAEVVAVWFMASQRAYEHQRHIHQPFGGFLITFWISLQLLWLCALVGHWRPFGIGAKEGGHG